MSRCATTPSLLDVRFAEVDLTRDQAAHVAACAECVRAFALLRRFDAGLESIGHDLAPERVGDVRELMRVTVPEEGSTVSWRRGLIGVAAVAVVLLAIVGVSALGERPLGAEVGRVLGLGIDRSEAAEAFGIPEHAVVIVDDDAVGLRVSGDAAATTFELLVMEADERQVRQVHEQRLEIRPTSAGMFTQPVRCFGVLERDIYAMIGMAWPAEHEQVEVGGVSGEVAAFTVRGQGDEGRAAVLLVAPADEIDDESVFNLRIGGTVGGGRSTGPIGHEAVDCAQPATATCGDWANWAVGGGTRVSMTQWLTESRLEAVRTAQQMPPNSTEAEIVNAAVSSIDKICQGSQPEERLTDIVERLYD